MMKGFVSETMIRGTVIHSAIYVYLHNTVYLRLTINYYCSARLFFRVSLACFGFEKDLPPNITNFN
jgi:hypothetical protein